MATGGELVSTHMPKKSRVENWLHKCRDECQLLASVTLPLGSTVYLYGKVLMYLMSNIALKLRLGHMIECCAAK